MRALAACLLGFVVLAVTPPNEVAAASADAIFTAVGTGVASSCCDGGPAQIADINHPRGLAVLSDGSLLVVEAFGHRIRRISPTGTIATVAGTGTAGFSGDGGPATSAQLRTPHAVVALADGGFLIDDTNNYRVRRVWPSGIITTVAGTGTTGFSGDGGPAKQARISAPRGIAGTPDGTFYIADTDNNRVRRVSADGTITTVAGTGVKGYAGDGGQATRARLNRPYGVALLSGGGFLVTDTSNNRIRRVSSAGTITTFAGTGSAGFSGDGGPATGARLNTPHNTTLLPDARVLIADTLNARVRVVSTTGTITTFAGSATAGFSGEAGPPASARLLTPKAAAVIAGGVFIADADNNRVRFVGQSPWPAPPPGAGRVAVNGNATYTASSVVTVDTPAPGASQVRLSNSPNTYFGVLTMGRVFPASATVSWDLADTSTGGTPAEGRHVVYVQWVDAAGNHSAVLADSIVRDASAPHITAPSAALRVGTALGTTTVPVELSWTATDTASGIASVDLERSTNGGSFVPVAVSSGTATSSTLQLTPGSTYTIRVRATDNAGNRSAFATSQPFTVGQQQDDDSGITYAGAWTEENVASASGGTLTHSVSAANTATGTFTGRAIAWAAPGATDRGVAQLYVDGQLAATVDQFASSYTPRRVQYVKSWATAGTHTVQIRNLATSGRPQVDVDAFAILG